MPINRFETMRQTKNLITSQLKRNLVPGTVVGFDDLKNIFNKNKKKWELAKVTKIKDFITFLVEENLIKPLEIQVSKNKTQTKYLYGEPSTFITPLSIRNDSYFSHYTALYIHELTDNVPKNIYTNKEQSKKRTNNNELKQKNIDNVFSQPMRKTNHIAEFKEFKVILLNGKNTDRLGVINIDMELFTNAYKPDQIPVTNLERTLIDCTIRPGYAGGVQEVLNAYQRAKGNISVNKITAYLKKINYTYPYHQSIGFYLEKAGYKESQLKLIEKMEMNYKFYLTYNMDNPSFSKRWQLYYPQRF